MRIIIIISSFCLLITQVNGQIKGVLSKADGEPIPFANVILLNSRDSTLVSGAMTSESGNYVLERVPGGEYLLRFSGIGFKTLNTAAFRLASNEAMDRGSQILEEETTVLGEIVVQGEKPLYEQQIDRTVINVQRSVMLKGSTALQLLERSPGVYIDPQNGNISMNGKNSVMIMLNGKLIRIPVSQLMSMLNGINANDIETIELITTPGARYDAEGNAGMINIVTKRRDDVGTTGSLSATVGYGWREKASTSVSLSHVTQRTNIYGTYSFSHDNTMGGWYGYGSQNMPLFGGWVDADFWNRSKVITGSHNASLGIDFQLKDAVVGASILYNSSAIKRTSQFIAGYTVWENDSLWQMNSVVAGRSNWTSTMASIYIDKNIGRGKLSLAADYLHFENKNPTDASTFFSDASGEELNTGGGFFATRQRGRALSPIDVGVLKADYLKKFSGKVSFEAGLKGTLTGSKPRSTIESYEDGQWVDNGRAANAIDMREVIGAAYSTVSAELSPSLKLEAGLRYEYSYLHMTANRSENTTYRALSKLFPSVALTKSTSNGEWQFSFTKRIGRPSYNDLASYLSYNDPMSAFTGNPKLRPSITSNLKVGYTLSGYSFSLLASRDDHPIVRNQLTENATHDLMYLSPQNMAYQNNLMLQTSLPFRVTSWWSMNTGVNAGVRQFKVIHTKEPVEKTYFAWNVNGSQTFTLPYNVTFEMSGWYNGPQYDGSKKVNGFGMVNAGLKKELGRNAGSLQLAVTDVFKTMRIVSSYGTLTTEAFSVTSHVPYEPESFHAQIVKLTYVKSFGNTQVKRDRSRTTVSGEESDRVRKD